MGVARWCAQTAQLFTFSKEPKNWHIMEGLYCITIFTFFPVSTVVMQRLSRSGVNRQTKRYYVYVQLSRSCALRVNKISFLSSALFGTIYLAVLNCDCYCNCYRRWWWGALWLRGNIPVPPPPLYETLVSVSVSVCRHHHPN